ncbi:hypothetical protein, partial [Pseudomonas syringae group genomosp. 7]|uniref:hypothetical protein n=1 Tax=Pseudomonas syringae group genomosp. 7 TaxID=251699 RepID=UPI00377015B0
TLFRPVLLEGEVEVLVGSDGWGWRVCYSVVGVARLGFVLLFWLWCLVLCGCCVWWCWGFFAFLWWGGGGLWLLGWWWLFLVCCWFVFVFVGFLWVGVWVLCVWVLCLGDVGCRLGVGVGARCALVRQFFAWLVLGFVS